MGFWGSLGHTINSGLSKIGLGSDNLKAAGSDLTQWGGDAVHYLNDGVLAVQHSYQAQHDAFTRYGAAGWLKANALALPETVSAGHIHDPEADYSFAVTGNGTDNWSALPARNPAYRDVHGNIGSFGFDLVDSLHGGGYLPNGWTRNAAGQMVSKGANPNDSLHDQLATAPAGVDWETGIPNAIFDITLDPTLKLGAAAKAVRGAGLVMGADKVALAEDSAEKAAQLAKLDAAGTPYNLTADGKHALVGGRVLVAGRQVRALVSPDGLRATNIPYLVQTNKNVAETFQHLAESSTEQILNEFPNLDPVAGELGMAHTVQAVSDVFERAVSNRNYGFLEKGLPTTSITRRMLRDTPIGAGVDAIREAPIVRNFTRYRPFVLNENSLMLSGKEFDPDAASSINGIRRALMMSQSKKSANAILARYINTPELGEKVMILTKAFQNSIRAMAEGHGLSPEEIDNLPAMKQYTDDLQFLTANATRPNYGMDELGDSVFGKDPTTGEPIRLGLFHNQTGNLAFPDWNAIRRDIADAKQARAVDFAKMRGAKGLDSPVFTPFRGGVSSVLTRADDWLYGHYTARWFKNLALMSLGFALRVSAGEITPAIIANGARNVVGSSLMAHAARLNPTILDLAKEYGDDALVGRSARVAVSDYAGESPTMRTGTIKSVDHEAKTVEVRHRTPTGEPAVSTFPTQDVTLLHENLSDKALMQMAKEDGFDIDKGELPHIKAALGHAFYGVGRALVDDDYYRAGVRNILSLNGHLVAPGLSSNHDIPGTGAGPAEDLRNMLEQVGAHPDGAKVLGRRFTKWKNTDYEHPMFWHFAASEAAGDEGARAGATAFHNVLRNGGSKDEATQAFIDADSNWMKTAQTDQAKKFRTSMALYGQGATAYSGLRVRAVRGLVYGANGKLNEDVLKGIAGLDEMPSLADFAYRDEAMRPLYVKGRTLDDAARVPTIERMSQWGWRKFLHPTINTMSRAPIYTMYTAEEAKFLKPWVDAGLMDPMEAHTIAQTRAANRMLPLIHNTKLRNQASDVLRNVFPFYFAQEQAYRRYGKAIMRDPVAFRRALIGLHGIQNSGIITEDTNGNKTLVIPGAGPLADLLTRAGAALHLPVLAGIPSMITGDTISLRTVVPEGNIPSASPLAAIALKDVQRYFPQSEPIINKALGPVDESSTTADLAIPNATIRRVLQASPVLDNETAFTTAYLYSIQWAMHQREELLAKAQQANDPEQAAKYRAQANEMMPGPNADPKVRQAALDRIKHNTRIQMMMKALIGTVSPLSPGLAVGDVKLRAELQDLMSKHGMAKGLQEFQKRNPNATADTVFLSDNSETGTALPATHTSLQWLESNRQWALKNSLAAAYLIPQKAEQFDSEAYNQELAMGLRQRKTPDQMVSALYTAATDAIYYPSLDRYLKAQKAATGDSAQQQLLADSWHEYTTGLANANPIWAATTADPQKWAVARNTLVQLEGALHDPATPDSPQTQFAHDLVASYNNYVAQQENVRNGNLIGTSLSALKDDFNNYLDTYAKQNPNAAAMVTGIFRRLVNDAPIGG